MSDITPTVCLGAPSVVVYTYGCDDGRNGPTRCAVIDGGLGDRCSQCWACRRPPAGAGSARIGLVVVSRQASIADPGGLHRSRTIPRSRTTPYDDASLARCGLGTHPSPPHFCRV